VTDPGRPSIDLPDRPLADPATGIVLRPWRDTPEDAGALLTAWTDPAIGAVGRVPADTSPAAATRWLRAEPARRAAGACLDLVVAASSGDAAVLGEVGLRNVDRGRGRAELSWWILAEHRGRGLATAAARLVVGWALSDAGGFAQVWCRIPPGHPASSAVARAAGLVELGTAEGVAVWARTTPRGPARRTGRG
jgi:RimJ/RimL family protein N-acetyltransferase